MSNIKRPEKIEGYEHPSESNNFISRYGVYKTFTEGQKTQEEFGNTTAGKQYAINTYLDDDKCPICEGIVVKTCKCSYSDKICVNGHKWYTDREGNIKTGIIPPH